MNTATCPKCDGNKYIQAFSGYAGGICFCCNGAGVIKVHAVVDCPVDEEKRARIAAENNIKREWLLKATKQQIEKLTIPQLCRARDFASACLHYKDDVMRPVHRTIMQRFEREYDAAH